MHSNSSIFDLTGKTALVTGASSGLGRQFARTLSSAGARVIVASRRIDRLDDLAKELGNAVSIGMDVTKKESVKTAIAQLEQAGEKIDICFNNAGWAWHTAVFAKDDDDNAFETLIQTNLTGVWYVIKAVADHMRRNNIEGSIINTASIAGAGGLMKYQAAYCASKAAVIQMTRNAVSELAEHKIRINCILPGFFPSEMTDFLVQDKEKLALMVKTVPVGFFPETTDLDGVVLLLASNKASRYITGASIVVDGGVTSVAMKM